jgi:hypothetical protein
MIYTDPLHISIGITTFLVGVLVGIALREAYVLAVPEKGADMATDTPTPTRGRIPETARKVGARRLGIVLVTAALAVNACLGFLLITTRAAQEDQAKDLEDLVSCITDYNVAEGKARDERDEATKATTEVEAALWRRLRIVLTQPSSSIEAITAAIDEYLISVEELQATRYDNPYPDPESCARLDK